MVKENAKWICFVAIVLLQAGLQYWLVAHDSLSKLLILETKVKVKKQQMQQLNHNCLLMKNELTTIHPKSLNGIIERDKLESYRQVLSNFGLAVKRMAVCEQDSKYFQIIAICSLKNFILFLQGAISRNLLVHEFYLVANSDAQLTAYITLGLF